MPTLIQPLHLDAATVTGTGTSVPNNSGTVHWSDYRVRPCHACNKYGRGSNNPACPCCDGTGMQPLVPDRKKCDHL